MSYPVIFFGNGPLANFASDVLRASSKITIIFHAKTADDLKTVVDLKKEHPTALGILASFGIMIKSDLLELFTPEGILNIHPSLLPLYRGASPIESAILAGDSTFSVSVMKLVKAMDAGPIYFQETFDSFPLNKTEIYRSLATAGASWILANIENFAKLRLSPNNPKVFFPSYLEQDDTKATFTRKLDKSMSFLTPELDSAETTLRKIVAFQDFPKPKYKFFNQEVIILSAHIEKNYTPSKKDLFIACADGKFVIIDKVQPTSRRPMDGKAFINGFGH